ncbi:MAG TPA: MltA domain-containing protein [Bauldia sp.]|nr:MltA domain-containing protein [Bauldia sp.]
MASAPSPPDLRHLGFDALNGWRDDDQAAALAAFREGAAVLAEHPPKRRAAAVDTDRLTALLRASRDVPAGEARSFFEANFRPVEVLPSGSGFFTGYYEPVLAGSRHATAKFTVPLLRAPDDLVEIDPDRPPAGIPEGFRFARQTAAGLQPYFDRGEIERGALAGRGLELVWLADRIDAFFVHIQGAAQIRLAEGGTMRVTYAAKTGHPYTSVGKVLVERGILTLAEADMTGIRSWLAANRYKADAILWQNRSYIFFREAPVPDAALGPIAAAKVPLHAGRSLAVDRLLHSFHLPVWIETEIPGGGTFRRLMIAHDTGSAIVGPARADIFFGSGDEAGAIAGRMRGRGRFVLLVPDQG